MLDVMGLNQHHDAVSGTSRQIVADDYVWRISKAMNENSEEYTRLVTDKVKLETGMITDGEGWKQCQMTNSTWLDCPVSHYSDEKNFTMSVAIHNPSTNDMKKVKIAVPKGNYEAKVYNKDTQ
jgi:hypothetical protein